MSPRAQLVTSLSVKYKVYQSIPRTGLQGIANYVELGDVGCRRPGTTPPRRDDRDLS